MTDDLLIRPLEPADAADAARVWWKARHADREQLPAAVHTAEQVAGWFADVLLPDGQTWVAVEGEQVVAVLTLDGDDLDQLYVDPDRAGEGIGSVLVELAKDLRPGGLALWTFQSNTKAQAFYQRHGFTEVRRTDGAANEEHAPDIRMTWGHHPEAAVSRER